MGTVFQHSACSSVQLSGHRFLKCKEQNQDLYIASTDLARVFVTVNQDSQTPSMSCRGKAGMCPSPANIQQIHMDGKHLDFRLDGSKQNQKQLKNTTDPPGSSRAAAPSSVSCQKSEVLRHSAPPLQPLSSFATTQSSAAEASATNICKQAPRLQSALLQPLKHGAHTGTVSMFNILCLKPMLSCHERFVSLTVTPHHSSAGSAM